MIGVIFKIILVVAAAFGVAVAMLVLFPGAPNIVYVLIGIVVGLFGAWANT